MVRSFGSRSIDLLRGDGWDQAIPFGRDRRTDAFDVAGPRVDFARKSHRIGSGTRPLLVVHQCPQAGRLTGMLRGNVPSSGGP